MYQKIIEISAECVPKYVCTKATMANSWDDVLETRRGNTVPRYGNNSKATDDFLDVPTSKANAGGRWRRLPPSAHEHTHVHTKRQTHTHPHRNTHPRAKGDRGRYSDSDRNGDRGRNKGRDRDRDRD